MRFVLTRLSSSTSLSPLSICLVWPDFLLTQRGKTAQLLVARDQTLTFLVPVSPKQRLLLSSSSILPADLTH